ncbi:MAG: Rv3654c family TadE-like protein [Acidimicrobiia bacterium]
MSSEGGSASVVMLALAMVMVLLGAALGAVGQYLAARLQAATAADAAALAAAPVSFAPFGAEGGPAEEAALFAAANHARLLSCRCPLDRTWAARTVEVEVEAPVDLLLFGPAKVRARSRAEFVPTRLLAAGVEDLLSDPRLVLSGPARADLGAGRVDPRLTFLLAAVLERHSLVVGVIATGHAKFVRGTERVSNHYHGRAMDITAVDGEPVRGSSGAARRLVDWLAGMEGPLRPDEVGSPFPGLGGTGFFSDGDHLRHIHVGFDT